MTITGQSALNKDDIDRMVRDAEAHADDDRRRREAAEVRNNADTLLYQSEKLLNEHGDRISGEEKERVESSLQGLKDALNNNDLDAIRAATESLVTASQAFSQRLYQESAQQGDGASATSAGAPNDDEVVDAEIVEEEGSSA